MSGLRCAVVVGWVVLFGCTMDGVDLASKTACPCGPGYECVADRCERVDRVRDVPGVDGGAAQNGDGGDDAASGAGGAASRSDAGPDGALACDDGDADCNGDAGKGCALLGTTADCGSCGNDCNALADVERATCVEGKCRIDECVAGTSDCNDLVSDGCEQPHVACTLELATFDSVPSQTGSVRSNQTLHVLETLVGTGTCTGVDYDMRAVVSFDTAALPDDAEIASAVVTLAQSPDFGDPWAGERYLAIDIADGCFGTSCDREGFDYAAAAAAPSVAVMEAWSSGTQDSSELSPAGLAAIDRTGTTQLRVRYDTQLTCGNWIILAELTPHVLTIGYYAPR